jgi:hypothetical protein
VPWDVAQDVMTPEVIVILAGVARVLATHAQDERRRQMVELQGNPGEIARLAREDETAIAPAQVQADGRGRGSGPPPNSSFGTGICGFMTASSASGSSARSLKFFGGVATVDIFDNMKT